MYPIRPKEPAAPPRCLLHPGARVTYRSHRLNRWFYPTSYWSCEGCVAARRAQREREERRPAPPMLRTRPQRQLDEAVSSALCARIFGLAIPTAIATFDSEVLRGAHDMLATVPHTNLDGWLEGAEEVVDAMTLRLYGSKLCSVCVFPELARQVAQRARDDAAAAPRSADARWQMLRKEMLHKEMPRKSMGTSLAYWNDLGPREVALLEGVYRVYAADETERHSHHGARISSPTARAMLTKPIFVSAPERSAYRNHFYEDFRA